MHIPLISIIVPIYNVEEFLSECIDSILAQSYDNLEIILVNDGSPDSCGTICDYYAQMDNRIFVVHKQNGGLSDARNAGLDIFKGEYVAFVDSDDVIHGQFVELLYKSLIFSNSEISFCGMQRFESFNEVSNTMLLYSEETLSQTQKYTSSEMLTHLGFSTSFVFEHTVSCNKMYLRSVFDNLRFSKGKIHEDEIIIHHIYSGVLSVAFIDLKLYWYRYRKESIVNSLESSLKRRDIMIDVYRERIKLFEELDNKRATALTKFKLQRLDRSISNINLADLRIILTEGTIPLRSKIKTIFYRIFSF